MATQEELVQRIQALEAAGLPAEDEKAELKKLLGKSPEASTETRVATPADSNVVLFDIEVDLDAFNEGGQQFGAPEEPGIYQGTFEGIITPTTKEDQLWFVFQTADPRLERQVRSALIISPSGKGAFKLKDVLENLEIPYTVKGRQVSGAIPKGLPCQLEYQEVTASGKTSVRLQNVWKAGKVESGIG
jgi:hypothetical protein